MISCLARNVASCRGVTLMQWISQPASQNVIKRPIVSANMDTITRAEMAVVLAEEGGIGVIDRGFRPGDIQPQIKEVTAVKRTQHGVISDPHTILPARLCLKLLPEWKTREWEPSLSWMKIIILLDF